jgi:hypothetical protein
MDLSLILIAFICLANVIIYIYIVCYRVQNWPKQFLFRTIKMVSYLIEQYSLGLITK